jgi:EmrB/QacA subfamily drug resistance transporter
LAILTAIFPPERRGAALGVWGAVIGLSTVAGPTVGGLIVTDWSWPWIFFINVPIGIVSFAATLLIVPDLRPGRPHRFDVVGVLLASAALFAVVFGLIEGQRYDWGTITGFVNIPSVLAAGVVLFASFLVWEARQAEPLVPLELFRDRNYTLMNWVGAAMQFGMQGIFIPFTIYVQSVLGMSALLAGLTVAPMSVASGAVAPASGRLADRIGGKYILMLGLVLFAGGTGWLLLTASLNSTWASFLPAFVVAGVGLGCVFAPMTTVAMAGVTPQLAGAASGVLNTTRQLGAAIGSAVVGAVLQNQLATALHARAVTDSTELPPAFRSSFVDAFSNAARSGLEVGRGQSGAAALPAGLPPPAVAQVQALARDVFANAFLVAMRPTVLVAVAVLLVAALSCLLVAGRRRQAQALPEPEPLAA